MTKYAILIVMFASTLAAQVQLGKGVQVGTSAVTGIIPGANVTCSTEVSGKCTGDVVINAIGGGSGAGQQFFDFDAFTAQTNPTSNDGIHNSLQSNGNAVNAGITYPITEFQSYGNNVRFPMFWTGFPIVPVSGVADGTTLYDYRAASRGRFDHNPNPISLGGPTDYTKLVRDNNVDGYQTFEDYVQGQQLFCCGLPSNQFGQDFISGWEFNLQDNTAGIESTFTIQAAKPGQGDFQLLQLLQHVNGQCNTPSDECGANMRRISQVDNEPFFGTLNSTVAPGNNVFPITPDGNSIYAGEMKLMTDRTQRRAAYDATATAGNGYPNPGTFTITQTVTPDTRCVVNSTISINGKIKGGTTSTAFAVTGCTAAVVTTLPACIAGAQNVQSVKVTSGGTTSITANMFSGIGVGDVLYQGPNACTAVSVDADSFGSYAKFVQIIGAPSAHVLEYVSMGAGLWQGTAGSLGQIGAFSTFGLVNTATLTRNGSGTVSANVTFQDTFGLFLKACINVTSAIDTSFNGVHCVLTDDGANPSTITWADSGGAATTTTTAVSYQIAANGVQANQLTLYPACRIVQASNPSTLQNDGTMVCMEHSWTGNTGDTLVSGPSDQLPFAMDHSIWQNLVPTSPQLAGGTQVEAQVINPCPQCVFFDIGVSTSHGDADMLGGGGTLTASYELIKTKQQALFSGYFDFGFTPVSNGGNEGFITRIFSCGIYPCSSPFSKFFVIGLPGAGGPGEFTEEWHPDIQTMQTVVGGSNIFQMNPTGTFFGQAVNVQDEVSVNGNGAGLALFSAISTNGSARTGSFEAGATGAHTRAYATFGTGNPSGLPGVTGVYDETTQTLVWHTCTAGGIFFGTPRSGGDVCNGVGAVASIDATGAATFGGTGHSIQTGTASNSDLAGQVTLSGGSGTQALAGTYTSAPIVVCSDTTAVNAVKCVASTTTITITGTGTDVINYITIGRN